MSEHEEHDRLLEEIYRSGPSSDPFAAAVRATRMPMLITDPHRPDNPIVFVNNAFTKLTGYSREEIINRNCRFLQGPETSREDVARIRSAIARQVPIEIELLNHKKNGEVFYNRLLISPVFDQDGRLSYFFASQFDVTLERDRLVRVERDRLALEEENRRRQIELQQAESRMQFLLKAGRFGSWTLDLEDRRLVASEICKANFGRRPQDPFSYQDLIEAIYPDDRARMQQAVEHSIETDTEYQIEYRVMIGKDIRWVEIRGQTFYRSDGKPLSMAGVSIDITERKRAEEHREILAGELNHRVKNSMATLQSIAHQTLRSARTLDEARTNLDARLQSLSIAHDVLTFKNWEGAQIEEVVRNALIPFRGKTGSRFSFGGPAIRITPKATLAMAMTLHELATNAVKYGALSNDVGRVIVDWDIDDSSAPALFVFRWQELDGPAVTPPSRTGFGSRMIDRMLVGEVGATIEMDYRSYGLLCNIKAPLERVAGSRHAQTGTMDIGFPGEADSLVQDQHAE